MFKLTPFHATVIYHIAVFTEKLMYDNCILKLNVHKLPNKLTPVSGSHTSFNILSETLAGAIWIFLH